MEFTWSFGVDMLSVQATVDFLFCLVLFDPNPSRQSDNHTSKAPVSGGREIICLNSWLCVAFFFITLAAFHSGMWNTVEESIAIDESSSESDGVTKNSSTASPNAIKNRRACRGSTHAMPSMLLTVGMGREFQRQCWLERP